MEINTIIDKHSAHISNASKYNFVILGSKDDYHEIAYSDMLLLTNTLYIPDSNRSKFLNTIQKLYFSSKINRIINLPFKSIWYKVFFKNLFENDNPICFLFFSSWLKYEKHDFLSYLKKKYTGCKTVYFAQDLIALKKNINIDQIKKSFDLVITFDLDEAKKFNILYHPTVYSSHPILPNDYFKKSDIYFLGSAKNRFNKIISIFEKLKSNGILCEFYIAGVPRKKEIYPGEINYISYMPYYENLMHVNKTKCILEVMQDNSIGHTFRTWEAISYDKKLLTNNPEIINTVFYDDRYISIFKNETDINIDFLKSKIDKINYKCKDHLSPKHLLQFIEKKL